MFTEATVLCANDNFVWLWSPDFAIEIRRNEKFARAKQVIKTFTLNDDTFLGDFCFIIKDLLGIHANRKSKKLEMLS